MTRLQRAALLAFSVHFIAGISMALVLGRGLDTNPDLQDRLAFLVNHRVLWTTAWLTWTVAGPAILYFYMAFADANPPAPRIAIFFTVVAIAPDLIAQSIEFGVLPGLASQALRATATPELFLTFNRVAIMLSGYLANGLYSVAALILVWSSRNAYPKWVSSVGFVMGLFGLGLSIAVLLESVSGMFWTNVGLVPALLVWLAGVAYTDRSGNPHGTDLPCAD